MMLKVGITGGMGSGKSTVCNIFSLLGIPIFYADDEAKKLYDTNKDLKSSIIKHFGTSVYPHGVFDRKIMKSLILNDPQKLTLLNELVHPKVREATEEWIQMQQAPYIIKEAALLIESDSYKQMNEIIFVDSPIELRMKRIMQRDQLDENQIKQLIDAQMSINEKKQYATQTIINDEKHLLIPQVLSLHHLFLTKCAELNTL
jgi:dephospho-CoA kinase